MYGFHKSILFAPCNYSTYFISNLCMMIFREAVRADIPQMHVVRNGVKENVLSNPGLVTDSDYLDLLFQKGKGWVCVNEGLIVGFSIVDLAGRNIWALFVLPGFEKQGFGKKLHQLMMDWYFSKTNETVWLSTAPKSRAELFYRKAGWKETGIYGNGEIKFEMAFEDWVTK